jgi:plasmid stability protein
MRHAKREAFELLSRGTPAAAQRLLLLAASDDERIAVVATAQVLDRVLGKASEGGGSVEDSARSINLAVLTPDERDQLLAALATVRGLRDLAATRTAIRGGRAIDEE